MNRFVRPIMFAFEPDMVFVAAKVSFGASGAPTLDTKNSKGVCNISLNTETFTGTTANASPTVSAVSSFAGLYPGMLVSDGGVHIPAATTISSMNAGAGTITLSQNATGTNTGLTATGGYIVQFGTQAGVRLDAYNKLLVVQHIWDETGLPGTASVAAGSPQAPNMIINGNNISIRTIPGTVASALSDASITVYFGTVSAGQFTVVSPGNGEICRLMFKLVRSGAI